MVKNSFKMFLMMVKTSWSKCNDGEEIFEEVFDDEEDIFEEIFNVGEDIFEEVFNDRKDIFEEVFDDGENIFEEVFDDGENIFEELFDDDEIKERSYLVIKAKEVMACDVSPVAMFIICRQKVRLKSKTTFVFHIPWGCFLVL